jgi:hypothetical protein
VSESASDRVWPPGAATAIGSLPGTDPAEASRFVLGELPELPYLAELPARGPGAEMIGRSGALLVDLPVDIVSTGWRLAARPGRDLRRARDLLARDLDALEQAASGYAGALKIQAAGPWTLAAALELPSGHRAVSDHGAVRELASSLAEGLRQHLAEVRTRVPGARVVLQLDEPSIGAVRDGRVPTPSGYGTVPAVPRPVLLERLSAVLAAGEPGVRVVHDCGPGAPISLFREAGADAVSVDVQILGAGDLDELAEAVDGGMSLWAGVVPATDAQIDSADGYALIARLWSELGFDESQTRMAPTIVPTPACGLAGATPDYARRATTVVREIALRLVEGHS